MQGLRFNVGNKGQGWHAHRITDSAHNSKGGDSTRQRPTTAD